jgi:hypothetical protein
MLFEERGRSAMSRFSLFVDVAPLRLWVSANTRPSAQRGTLNLVQLH